MPRNIRLLSLLILVIFAPAISVFSQSGSTTPSKSQAASRKADWPLKRAIDLSSGFGDFRENRFHAGVDLRTGGQIGSRIYSPVDGYVWRVKMSYEGYGKGLYVRDADGQYHVFGHLSQLANKIAGPVLAEQYRVKRYYVDLYFPPDSIPIKKGEFLGLTGQTGAGAPHLHYEVRNANNRPINPLTAGWKLNDHVRPTFERIGFALVDDSSLFDNGRRKMYFDVRRESAGDFVLDTVPFINAPFGVLAEVYDQMRPGSMRQAVYKLTLSIDGVEMYRSVMDSLDFEHGPSVNLEYDFVEAVEGRTRTRRLYDRAGNIYPGSKAVAGHGGVFGSGEFPAVRQYDGVITAEDAFGNESTLRFSFFWGPPDDFYVLDTLIVEPGRRLAVFLKPRDTTMVVGADTILLESATPQWREFDRIESAEYFVVKKESEGWLSITPRDTLQSTSADFFQQRVYYGRLAKHYSNGDVRYETVFDDIDFPDVAKEHYSVNSPVLYEVTEDGLTVSRRWDGIHLGSVGLQAINSGKTVLAASAPQRWQSNNFLFFVPPKAIDDQITSLIISGPVNDSIQPHIFKVGHNDSCVSFFDDAFRVVTWRDNFYEPRLIEIKHARSGKLFAPSPVSKVYQVLPEAFVTKSPFTVELRVDAKIANAEKIGLCWWNEKDNTWVWINDDSITAGTARGKSQGGGYFAAVQDLDRPKIRNLNIKDGMTVNTVWPDVTCNLVDSLSGIRDDRSIDVRLNGDWLIPEYDPERGVLVAKPFNPVKPGKCTLTISVVDRVGNKTELTRTFHVVQQ